MFKQIILRNKINKFYNVFGSELYNAPTHTTLRDVNDSNFLADVLYDISEILPCAPNKAAREWLTKLEHNIRTYDECKTSILSNIFAIIATLFVLWVGVSTLEVSCKNLNEKPQYSPYNVWSLLLESTKEHTRYIAQGRYYTDGTVITADGNEWSYSTDTISDKAPYDGMPVSVGLDDNGTPNDITDDIILGLVWDINTSVYDELENALSDKFEITRDGNNIRIGGIK